MVDLTLPDAAPAPPEGSAGDPAVPAADDGIAAERLIARVRAWQHRHPLARRIAAREVVGIGVIALPYGPAEGGAGGMRPLYHQPRLLPGLSHRALVAFAERHAVRQRPGSPAWPQRDVERADAAPEPAPETRYLLTAAIDGAAPRPGDTSGRRLLLAPAGPAIWGRRPLSRTMLTAAAAALVLAAGAAGWGLRSSLTAAAPGSASPRPLVPAAAPLAPAASVASAASAASAARVVASAAVALPVVASSGPPVAAGAAAPAAPGLPSTAASAGASAVSAPEAAAAASVPARPASVATAAAAAPPVPPATEALPPPRLLPMPGARRRAEVASAPPSPSLPLPPAAPVVASAAHYALVSAPEKKRAAAEATLHRVHLLLGPAIGNLQTQVMPAPGGFVVTVWPLPTQADAEQLAAVLARRGVPMKWMEF